VTTERVNPPELSPPTGFTHAVVAAGSRVVFLAGQTALDTDGKITGETLTEQFEKALGNLLTALRAAGGTPADLARPSTGAWARLSRDGRRGGRPSVGRAGAGGAGRVRRAALTSPAPAAAPAVTWPVRFHDAPPME
jgi:hypothetical protein